MICQVIHRRLVSRHLHGMRVPFVSALAPLREWHTQTVPMEWEPCEGTLQCCFMLLGAGEGQLMQEDLFIFPAQFDRSVCFPQSYIPRFLCDCIQPKSAVERSSPSPWCSHWSIAFWEKLLKPKQPRQGPCLSPANSPPASPCLIKNSPTGRCTSDISLKHAGSSRAFVFSLFIIFQQNKCD